ncbi:hypothetical protein ACFV1D_02985 [Streptomyces mirabilis]
MDGPFLVSRAFLPDLKESGSGRIINISPRATGLRRLRFSPMSPPRAR